jgi:hypothetical protein
MAKAATLALAGIIIRNLNINEASFPSDNQQLVTYMNIDSNEEIPRWEARKYTQILRNTMVGQRYKVYKISSTLNTSAHVLASQARYPLDRATNETANCHSATHISSCPIYTVN